LFILTSFHLFLCAAVLIDYDMGPVFFIRASRSNIKRPRKPLIGVNIGHRRGGMCATFSCSKVRVQGPNFRNFFGNFL